MILVIVVVALAASTKAFQLPEPSVPGNAPGSPASGQPGAGGSQVPAQNLPVVNVPGVLGAASLPGNPPGSQTPAASNAVNPPSIVPLRPGISPNPPSILPPGVSAPSLVPNQPSVGPNPPSIMPFGVISPPSIRPPGVISPPSILPPGVVSAPSSAPLPPSILPPGINAPSSSPNQPSISPTGAQALNPSDLTPINGPAPPKGYRFQPVVVPPLAPAPAPVAQLPPVKQCALNKNNATGLNLGCKFDSSTWDEYLDCAIGGNAVFFDRTTDVTCQQCEILCADNQDSNSPYICVAMTYNYEWSYCDLFAVGGILNKPAGSATGTAGAQKYDKAGSTGNNLYILKSQAALKSKATATVRRR